MFKLSVVHHPVPHKVMKNICGKVGGCIIKEIKRLKVLVYVSLPTLSITPRHLNCSI